MTKEDFLKQIIKNKGSCEFVPCNSNCPYYDSLSNDCKFSEERIRVIMAKILLRSFPTQESEIERLKCKLVERDYIISELNKTIEQLRGEIDGMKEELEVYRKYFKHNQ